MTAEQSKALDRIQKLMRLATNNPNDDEARTAALQAVRLVQQHGFALTVAEATATPRPQPQRPADHGFDYYMRQYMAAQAAQDAAARRQREAGAAWAEMGRQPNGRPWHSR